MSKEDAEAKEIELIYFYKSNQRAFGYNIESGGNVTGVDANTRTKIKVICIETCVVYDSIREAGRQTNTSNGAICNCLHGIRKTAGGFHWDYYNNETLTA